MKGIKGLVSICAALAVAAALMFIPPEAFAKEHEEKALVIGSVSAVDVPNQTFTVVNAEGAQTVVTVAPDTKFRVKRENGSKVDVHTTLGELRANDRIRVSVEQTLNAGLAAHGVKVYR